ncbi:hypothetical protein [Streptomyces sp. NPDC093594]
MDTQLRAELESLWQSDILYRVWSEEAHAAPQRLIADVFRQPEEG